MWRKIFSEGQEAREKFLNGVNAVDKLVGNTLGPGGRNRLIPQKYKAPWVLNDGAEIARRIVLNDPVEDLAAQTIIEVAIRTAEQAGDGTTTSVVIATELIRDCYDRLSEKSSILEGGPKTNAMGLWREIQSERDKAVEILKGLSREIRGKDLDNVVATSLENLEYGKELGKLLREVGKDGYVSVEDNWATKYGISTEIVAGMKFLGTYASPYLMTSSNKKEAVWEDTYVLVTNHKVEDVKTLAAVLKEMGEKGSRKLVVIGGFSEGANPFSAGFIESIARAMYALTDPRVSDKGSIIQVLAVKAPSLTSPELEDVATFCNATFIDKNLGHSLKDVKLIQLGYAKKVSVTEDEVNIVGGQGNTAERIEVLKGQAEVEKDVMFKEKVLRRIASLSSGVGVIRVGAQTESERSYLKEKIKDAVSAAKASLEEGVVKGGGLALEEVAKKLGKESILYRALNAPSERVRENMGGDLEVESTVLDPTKVMRLALENACSGAGILVTTDAAIAEERLTYQDYLEKALKASWPTDEKHDFRDEENRDLGRPGYVNG